MNARIRTTCFSFLAIGAALVFAAPAVRAQDVTVDSSSAQAAVVAAVPTPEPVVATSPAPVGPTLNSAAVGVRRTSDETRNAPAPAAPRGGYGQSVSLMVVGGAALLTGLIVGGGAGYAISVGGAVVGLIGLYQYLQ